MNYPEVTPENIWNFRQNNPELVIQDAAEYLGLNEEQQETLRQILLARGINKWLKVRRDLIVYKKVIQKIVRELQEEQAQLKEKVKAAEFKSSEFYKINSDRRTKKQLVKALSAIRGDLKRLCMTERMQVWPRGSHHDSLKKMTGFKTNLFKMI